VHGEKPPPGWLVYVRNVVIWFLITGAIAAATVWGTIYVGIPRVMDYFLRDDRFYEGFAASLGVSVCGVVILFLVIFLFIRRLGRYPRAGSRRLDGI
jgi:hypothetical protein